MFRFLLSVVALVALTAAVASPLKGNETPTVTPQAPVLAEGTAVIQDTPHDVVITEGTIPNKADATHGVMYTEERITKLPQDQNKFYLTVMGNKTDKKYQDILGWFKDVPELKTFKDQTHFNPIDTSMKIYAERYQKTVPSLPCIRVQQADGKTLFQCSGANVPMTGEALAKGFNTECIFRFRRNRNPNPNPEPDPAPNPDTDGETPDDEGNDSQPDINIKVGPKTDPKSEDQEHWMTVLGILAAVGGGLAVGGGHGFASKLQEYRANHR